MYLASKEDNKAHKGEGDNASHFKIGSFIHIHITLFNILNI